jgi:MarR family transcriptional regulator, temperature-dependent positive regulator of motility
MSLKNITHKKISEDTLKIMQLIEEDRNISQRQISNKLGLSLGKINYCISALKNIGFVKVKNFTDSNKKINHLYLLTPLGIHAKTITTMNFITKKKEEYDILVKNIEKNSIKK